MQYTTMKKIIISSIAIVSALIMGGCSKFGEINTNPDKTTMGNSGMLATGLLRTMTTCAGNGDNKNYVTDDFLSKYIAWTESSDIDLMFNKLNNASFSDIAKLVNATKMVEAAPTEGLKKSYQGLAHFVRVMTFYNATMRVGDIPYSEAIKGEEGVYFPKYDTQKDVFLGMLNELDAADQLFAEGDNFSGDYLYGGDCAKWRKACNVLQLRLLINLYKKTDDADVNLKTRFAKVLSRPLFESIDDNLQVVWSDKAGQKFPYTREINSFTSYDQVSDLVIDKLKELKDYRVFAYANPTPNSTDPSAWESYNGVNPCQHSSAIIADVSTGNFSGLNLRYEDKVGCEPTFFLSYQEMNFILAEAAARGLISGDAATYYNEGIRSSMEFVSKHSTGWVPADREMTADYIASYIASPEVKFASTLDAQVEQIIWQKYITTFLQTPYSAFFEYRRTNVPNIKIDPGSNKNDPSDKMPLRWMYPTAENSYNKENLTEAVNRQYNGSDDYMGVMWILK